MLDQRPSGASSLITYRVMSDAEDIGAAAIAAYPDGASIRFRATIGKVVPNAKRHDDGSLVFTYSIADEPDLEVASVSDYATRQMAITSLVSKESDA